MATTPKCRAGNPETCTDPNCPQRKAAFAAFVATLSGEKAPERPKIGLPRIKRGKVTLKPKPPTYVEARAAFETLISNYEDGTANQPELKSKLKDAYTAAKTGLAAVDTLGELGAKTGKGEPAPKQASLRDARQAFQNDLDYWNNRRFNGDPLFDQWMWDAAAKDEEGLQMLNWLEDLGADTGAADIQPKVRTTHETVELKVRPGYRGGWQTEVIIDNNMHTYSGDDLQAATKEEAYALLEARTRKEYGAKISAETTKFKLS